MQSFIKKASIFFTLLIICSFSLKTNAQTAETDSLENRLQQHIEKDTIRVHLLNETAYKLYRIDLDKTLKYAEESGELAAELNFPKGQAESMRLIGIYYDIKSDYPKALEYFQKSLEITQKLGNKKGIARAYNNIGIIYDGMGDYTMGIEYYQKSLKIRIELGDKIDIASSYGNIGVVYNYQGDYPKALEHFHKSLKIREELNDKSGISSSLNNIGVIYNSQGNYSKALEYFQKSLVIREELGDRSGVANSYMGIGNIYKSKNDYSNALEYYNKSLAIREELGDKRGVSSSCGDIGIIYCSIGNSKKALAYFQRSLQISIEIGSKSLEAWNYTELAISFLKQNKFDEAYIYSKKAYAIAEEIGELRFLKRNAKTLAKSCNALGMYKQAYNYHVVFKTMNDSLYNEENVKKIAGLEYQYKYEKEKQIIELEQHKKDAVRATEEKQQKNIRNLFFGGFVLMSLFGFVIFYGFLQKRKANSILAIQKEEIEEKNKELVVMNEEIQAQSEEVYLTNEKLSVLNATKDKFFSIIAHDLRNPFNALLGLSDILLEEHKEYNDEDREVLIKSINHSANGAFELVENLLMWSHSQLEGMEYLPQNIELKTFLQEVLIDIQGQANKKNIKVLESISENESVFADKNMMATVLRNLVSNAIKFTHKTGEIKISAERNEVDVIITVADTGVGIDKEKVQRIFDISEKTSTAGTENEKGTGLGLILCKEFVEKHGGKIWIESEVGVGSKFIFNLPINTC